MFHGLPTYVRKNSIYNIIKVLFSTKSQLVDFLHFKKTKKLVKNKKKTLHGEVVLDQLYQLLESICRM